jgi:hypothetical protein
MAGRDLLVQGDEFVRPGEHVRDASARRLTSRPQFQVLQPVVRLLQVLVMDRLAWQQLSTQRLLHHKAVLSIPSTSRLYSHIARLPHLAGADRNSLTGRSAIHAIFRAIVDRGVASLTSLTGHFTLTHVSTGGAPRRVVPSPELPAARADTILHFEASPALGTSGDSALVGGRRLVTGAAHPDDIGHRRMIHMHGVLQ